MKTKFDPQHWRVTFFDWDGYDFPNNLIYETVDRPMVNEVDFVIENEEYNELRLLMILGYTVGVAPRGTKFRLSIPKPLSVDLPLPFEVIVRD